MSNGGIMSFRLAEQMQPRPAGVVAVSASLPLHSTCPLTRAVPLLMIDGNADPVMPYAGGEIGVDRGLMLGAERTASAYAMLSEGKPPVLSPQAPPLTPRSSIAEAHQAGDATTADLLVYTPTNAALPVELLRINGGGHIEPSIAHHPPKAYAAMIGTQSTSIEAAEFAWQFLRTLHN
jgi:polyhydroxybutyrate depolymerase